MLQNTGPLKWPALEPRSAAGEKPHITRPMNSITYSNQPQETDPVRDFFWDLGPGPITGAADDGPSRIATYSVAGAAFSYAPLWTALFSFPLMVSVQPMCTRLGMVTGRGLARAIRQYHPQRVLWGAACCSSS